MDQAMMQPKCCKGNNMVRSWNWLGRTGVVWAICVPLAWGDLYEDGMEAKARGDYVHAVQVLRPLANRGDAQAQFELSLLYRSGQGVPADARESLRWLRLAAHGGHAPAQSNLGAAYVQGRGVPQDAQQAYVWLSAGAAQGSREAATNLEVVRRRMTPQQISQAQERAMDCAQRQFVGCD
jgi:TPR repeat protein